VLGMFVPGFFTGHLIRRFGVLPIMGVGVVLNLACIAIALSGVELHHFLVALFLLGVGWNFLFTGGTTLSLRPTARGEGPRAGGDQLLRLRHDGADLVRVGRAGHHAGLDAAQPRLAAAGGR
jgi:MFS family permease